MDAVLTLTHPDERAALDQLADAVKALADTTGCAHLCACRRAGHMLDSAILNARNRGITQRAIADVVGVTVQRVQQREKAARNRHGL